MGRKRRLVVLVVFMVLQISCVTPPVNSAPVGQVAPPSEPPIPSTPSAAAIVTVRPCRQQDVTASFDRWGAAAGSVGGTFRIAPTSADPCSLPARPATRFVDELGNEILSFVAQDARATWIPVRSGAGKDATFVLIQWSNHGGEPTYRCAARTAAATLEIELPSWRVALAFPPDQRPTFCADPAEQVFVEVLAR